MKKILAIIGARPQFIKHAPIEIAAKEKCEIISLHTGQHYDYNMSQIFFEELGMCQPKYNLSVGSGSHGIQTGQMMIDMEPIFQKEAPDAILVYGDTNSTLAGALVGAKLNIPIFHIEAGLRSFNKTMPEEINRILTDNVSDLLFAPTEDAMSHLQKEGISTKIIKTGDVMQDMIRIAKEKQILKKKVNDDNYIYMTMHRPYNTDYPERLRMVLKAINNIGQKIIYAIHPRTAHKMEEFEIKQTDFPNIEFIPPTSYFTNLEYIQKANLVITDSGGLQKEAYILKKRCITLRSETEWTETLTNNWNQLIFEDLEQLKSAVDIKPGKYKNGIYGNGYAAESIIDEMITFLQ